MKLAVALLLLCAFTAHGNDFSDDLDLFDELSGLVLDWKDVNSYPKGLCRNLIKGALKMLAGLKTQVGQYKAAINRYRSCVKSVPKGFESTCAGHLDAAKEHYGWINKYYKNYLTYKEKLLKYCKKTIPSPPGKPAPPPAVKPNPNLPAWLDTSKMPLQCRPHLEKAAKLYKIFMKTGKGYKAFDSEMKATQKCLHDMCAAKVPFLFRMVLCRNPKPSEMKEVIRICRTAPSITAAWEAMKKELRGTGEYKQKIKGLENECDVLGRKRNKGGYTDPVDDMLHTIEIVWAECSAVDQRILVHQHKHHAAVSDF